MDVVEVKSLNKAFGENRVLNEVSFSVKKGSFTALLGANGSGKSTILNILMGQLKLDSGDCFLFDQNIKDDPFALKSDIGLVTEKIKFDYPSKVSEFMKQYQLFFDNFDHGHFLKMARDVKLDLDKQFAEYSRGQKMQIVLMAALAQSPKLILIDEITSVLDAFARTYFTTLLKNFTNHGGTVVITTNIVNEVQFYCSDVIFLYKSKIKFQTSLSEIAINFKKIRIRDPHHSIRQMKECIWAGINSDGSQTYIVPKSLSVTHLEGIEEDRRSVTLEDLYIYHSQSDENEKAA